MDWLGSRLQFTDEDMWHNGLRRAISGWMALSLTLGTVYAAPQQGPQNTGTNLGGQLSGGQTAIAGQAGGMDPLGVDVMNQEMPCPFEPLAADHQKYLNDLLGYWENSTKQIQRFRCRFNRWDYDPVFGPQRDPETGDLPAATIATGEVKFEDPDKAMYEVTGLWTYTTSQTDEGLKAKYEEVSTESFEKWISDGKTTFEFDFNSKQVRKRQIPPELQGKTIADGPIPFIFGADAAKMKERYWIRVITPTEAQKAGEYWLEAYPKKRIDGNDFSRVKVILDKEFLPKAVEIYAAGFNEVSNAKSQTYVFEERKINESNLNLFKILGKPFYEPTTPSGWKMVDVDLGTGIATGPIPSGTAQDNINR